MAEIIWTPYALEDLQSIYDFISLDSVFYAGRFIDKLVNKVDILIEHPKAGKIVPEFENELIRELIEGNYRIIYKSPLILKSVLSVYIIRQDCLSK